MNQSAGKTSLYPDLNRIQTLLSDLYTREALVALCHDTPDLHRLYAVLSPTRGEADFIRQLVATAHRTNHLDRLLGVVQANHPGAYARHAPYYTSESPASAQEASRPTPTEAEPTSGQPTSGDRVGGDKITVGNIDAKGSAISIGRGARAETPHTSSSPPPVPQPQEEPSMKKPSDKITGSLDIEKVLAIIFGVVFIVVILIMAVAFPTPTPFQAFVFRVVLALSAAATVGAIISGFVAVNMTFGQKVTLSAGGAVAVFVLVYMLNPPQLV